MDKILSARVDESILVRIGVLARLLGKSKKAVIEAAIQHYAETIEQEESIDVLEQTLGVWKRSESPDETVESARQAFRSSMRRRHE